MRSPQVLLVLPVLLAVVPGAAAADDIPATWGYGMRATGDASRTSAREDSGSLGGEAHLRYTIQGSDCDTLNARQAAHFYWRDAERGAGFDGGLEVCMDQVDNPARDAGKPGPALVVFPRVIGGYDLRTAARPRLDAPPVFAVDDYSLYAAYFGWGFYERRDAASRDSAARFHARGDVTLQGPDAALDNPSQNLLTLSAAAYVRERARNTDAPFTLEAGRFDARFEGNHAVWLLDAVPLSFTSWRLGAWRLSASAGYSYAHMGRRRAHVPTASTRIERTVASRLTLGLRIQRMLMPAVDPIVVVDDRVTAEARYPLLGGALVAAGYGASTLALSTTTASLDDRELTGGGSLAFSRTFTRHLAWHATVEVGRSFYARLESDGVARAETVARASTGFEARLGR